LAKIILVCDYAYLDWQKRIFSKQFIIIIITSIIIVASQEFAKRSLFLERLVKFASMLSIVLFARLTKLNVIVFTIN